MNSTQMPVAKIVQERRVKESLTYRGFADVVNAQLKDMMSISQTTVMNWEKGITDPSTDFLLTCLVACDGWIVDFAIDCLCAKLPNVFEKSIDDELIILSDRVIGMEAKS